MKTILTKQVHGSFSSASSWDVMLEKELKISFVPIIGMEISIDGIDDTVETLWYDGNKDVLYIYTPEDKEIYDAELNKIYHRPIDEIVQEYLDEGWIRRNKNG